MNANILATKHYYHYNVGLEHQTGDVWSNLPTYGLLNQKTLPGIIITPSCDLYNQKVTVISYLPILSINEWLQSRCFYPSLREEIKNQCNKKHFTYIIDYLPKFRLPTIPSLIEVKRRISKEKQNHDTEHMLRALSIIDRMLGITQNISIKDELEILYEGKFYDKVFTRVVKNGFNSDIYFLPPDKQDSTWSILSNPSLVLLRYPLSAPVEIFDIASDILSLWSESKERLTTEFAIDVSLYPNKPVKYLNLQPTFMHDLITKYTGIYNRIGSPDFMNSSIKEYYLSM